MKNSGNPPDVPLSFDGFVLCVITFGCLGAAILAFLVFGLWGGLIATFVLFHLMKELANSYLNYRDYLEKLNEKR